MSVVAVLTAIDIGGRALPTLLARLLDTDLVPVVLSFLFGVLTNAEVLPTASPFLLYGYLVYTLTPRLFPDRLRHVTERRDYRLIATGYALLVPLLAFTDVPGWERYIGLSSLIVLPLYLVVVQHGAFLGRDGYPVAMVATFSLLDVQDRFEDDPDVRDRTLKSWVLLAIFAFVSVVYSWFVFLTVGVLLFFLSSIYPIPELLLSGWVGQRALLRGPVGPDETVLDRNHLDLETRVLTPVSVVLEGFKGLASVMMAVVGLGFGVIFMWISIVNVGTLVGLATRTPTFSPARLVLVVVGTLTLCGLGLYGVWYWVRMLARVPPFLDAWQAGLTSEGATKPEREEKFLPARPPGYFLPPMLLWWTLPVMHYGSWTSPRLPPAWAVLAWLAVFALTVWTAYRGVVSAPQPARTDQRALPVSFFLITVGTWIRLDLSTEGKYDLGSSYIVGLLIGRVSPDQFLAVFADPSVSTALGLVTVSLYFFWFEDIEDWSNRDDWRRYAYVPYVLVAVVTLGIAAALVGLGLLKLLFAATAAVLLGVTSLRVLGDLDVVDLE